MNYEIIQTGGFKSEAKKNLLTNEDIRLIEIEIMANPERFPVVAGTNGLRKMRFAPQSMNTGKSGGIRVCYFVIDSAAHIYLVTLFAKNEKDNFSNEDKAIIFKLIKRTKEQYDKK